MIRTRSRPWQGVLVVVLSLAAVACATKPAPNFKGRWQPINNLGDAPVELPLQEAHLYTASPLDRTLKSMLTRWARESRMTMSYLHGSDFTLYKPVADIRTASLQHAVSQLNAAYAAQGLVISVDASQITVRAAQTAVVPSTTPAPAPAAP